MASGIVARLAGIAGVSGQGAPRSSICRPNPFGSTQLVAPKHMGIAAPSGAEPVARLARRLDDIPIAEVFDPGLEVCESP